MTKSRLEGAIMLTGVIAPFVGTIAAIVELWQRMVTWTDINLMLGLYLLSGLGITIGYHRMMVHRSFEANPVVRFLFLVLGCLALEGSPRSWGATHIKHHANSDQADDPHSPLQGFFHAHMGWFINGILTELDVWGKWLAKDRVIMFVSKTYILWVALGFYIPYLIDGWQGVLWGGLVRIFLTHHITWSVNSVCHVFGKRMFETMDASRNNWIVGIFAFGEGWHNNHHAFPRSAFHGLRWWQIDISGYIIRMMEVAGLVKNVWRIPRESFEARLVRRDAKVAAQQVQQSKRAALREIKRLAKQKKVETRI
jgi:stearoyl-CoA desaturase (delta-9 desaturase)